MPSADPGELVPPRGAWFMAYSGPDPVGCAGLKRLSDDAGELKRLYARPGARGRGVGRSLMEAVFSHARAFGFERVCLDTGDQQPEALGLFGSLGFSAIEPYNDNPFASYWMERPLI